MSEANNPAFPIPLTGYFGGVRRATDDHPEHGGLSKREHFAAMALQGFCANSHAWEEKLPSEHATMAVQYADCLLRELAKETPSE